MNEVIGTCSLALAVLVASATFIAALAASRFETPSLLETAKAGLCLFTAFLTVAAIALLTALVDSDFSLRYVVHYTELALPTGYKIAAFWAGQEGSLLLWAWMLGGMSVLAAFTHRPRSISAAAWFIGTLAIVCGFFAGLMLFAANPFTAAEAAVSDGEGLNPLLQNIGMIVHPPLLFLGYGGCTIPFALLVGWLAGSPEESRRGFPVQFRQGGVKGTATRAAGPAAESADQQIPATLSLTEIRNWTIFAWLFLTIGILLGAQWAYVELGWGGYWAWDPVENASLLPWLTATALVHSIIVQQHRGMLKIWNALLIAVTFILCIFGTYLTRSGVVQSVHGFGASLVGTFFLIFLIILILGSAVLILMRLKALQSEQPLENLLGREGAFLIVNVLLSIMMLVTLYGTIRPALSGILGQGGYDQSFYNTSVVPLGLLLAALMTCGPLLVYGTGAGARLARGMIVPGIMAVATVAVMCCLQQTSPWALACGAIVAAGLTTTLSDLGRSVHQRRATTGEGVVRTAMRLLDSNHRRYGGQLAHVGMLMIIVGITGSSLDKDQHKKDLQMTPGQTVQLGRYAITCDKLEEIKGENFTAVQLTLQLTDPGGKVQTLRPQRRFYDKSEQPSSEVAIRSSLREDLYATLAGWEDDGRKVAVQAIINPLINWMWIGGIVMGMGGIVCLLPRFAGGGEEQTAAASTATQKQQEALVR